MSQQPVRVVFVCWGNICRSPMAERVARTWVEREGLADHVEITSAGVSTEELGNPIDPRAANKLTAAGHDAEGHQAHQIDAAEIDANDLVIAAEQLHADRMRAMGPQHPERIRLLTDFDPDAEPGQGVPDPWYGDADGFDDTLASVEAAMPALFEEVRRIAADRKQG